MLYEIVQEMERSNVLDTKTKEALRAGTRVTLAMTFLASGATLALGGAFATLALFKGNDKANNKQNLNNNDDDDDETFGESSIMLD